MNKLLPDGYSWFAINQNISLHIYVVEKEVLVAVEKTGKNCKMTLPTCRVLFLYKNLSLTPSNFHLFISLINKTKKIIAAFEESKILILSSLLSFRLFPRKTLRKKKKKKKKKIIK